jgi:hypothetical protein
VDSFIQGSEWLPKTSVTFQSTLWFKIVWRVWLWWSAITNYRSSLVKLKYRQKRMIFTFTVFFL